MCYIHKDNNWDMKLKKVCGKVGFQREESQNETKEHGVVDTTLQKNVILPRKIRNYILSCLTPSWKPRLAIFNWYMLILETLINPETKTERKPYSTQSSFSTKQTHKTYQFLECTIIVTELSWKNSNNFYISETENT